MKLHRFMYECWHGVIKKGMHIDHVDGNKLNNHLTNLQSLTPLEHRLKTLAQNPPMVMVNRRRSVICTNLQTGNETEYASAAVAARTISGVRF